MSFETTNHLEARLTQLKAARASVVHDHLDQLGREGIDLARRFAPIGPTGNYFNRLEHRVETDAVEIGSHAPHAHLVERGRSPGKMPPPKLIAALMDLSDRQAFLVARSIARKGTRGVFVFTQVRDALRPVVARTARDLARDLGGL